MSNQGKRWTEKDRQELWRMHQDGKDAAEIGKKLLRNADAILRQLWDMKKRHNEKATHSDEEQASDELENSQMCAERSNHNRAIHDKEAAFPARNRQRCQLSAPSADAQQSIDGQRSRSHSNEQDERINIGVDEQSEGEQSEDEQSEDEESCQRSGALWSDSEKKKLTELVRANKSNEEVAKALGRSLSAVQIKVHRLGGRKALLSKKRTATNNSRKRKVNDREQDVVPLTARKRHRADTNEQRVGDEQLPMMMGKKKRKSEHDENVQEVKEEEEEEAEGNIEEELEQHVPVHDTPCAANKSHLRLILRDWDLEQYYEELVEDHGFEDINDWKDISEADLREIGWTKLGHMRKFMRKTREYFDACGNTTRC